MIARVRLVDGNESDGGNYFSNQSSTLEFINSGATVLDCTLGGGWPLTRIANVVGDPSSGKSLLVIEAAANFHRQFPKGKIFYRESESAFDEEYAGALGMPLESVSFIDPDDFVTIEDFYEDLCKCVEELKRLDCPGLYAVDSLDALSDKSEQGRKFDEDSYAMGKPKQIGKLLRLCKSKIAEVRMCLIIISQTRDKIGSLFVQKTRSGGRALDFYASQILWLSHLGDVSRTKNKIKRVVGSRIRAKCTKNKVALPHRECEFTIRYGHGIDSLASSIDWLEEVSRLEDVVGYTKETFKKRLAAMDDNAYWQESARIDAEVVNIWREVEESFLEQSRPKYR